MTGPSPTTPQAQSIIEARLGRAPQDMLEAAVVLEAWGGVSSARALELGRSVVGAGRHTRRASTGSIDGATSDRRVIFEGIAFIAAMIAIACWATPLSESLGSGVVERALLIALPLTIALQWGVNSRYLSRPHGTVYLGRQPLAMSFVAGALILGLTAIAGQSGLIAGLFTVMWTGGSILIACRVPDGYVGLVLLATTGIYAGLSPVAVLASAAAITTVMVIVAVTVTVTRDEPSHQPGRWSRVAMAGAIGLGIGALLVADRTVAWSLGVVPALALLPSTVASFWGGWHLWRFQQVLQSAVAGIPVSSGAVRGRGRLALGLLAGALTRLVIATVALSVVLVAGAEMIGARTEGVRVLAGFGLVALATLLVGLLEAVGRGMWALAALAAAVAAAILVPSVMDDAAPGVGLIAGSALAVALSLPLVMIVLSRPATTLATRVRVT